MPYHLITYSPAKAVISRGLLISLRGAPTEAFLTVVRGGCGTARDAMKRLVTSARLKKRGGLDPDQCRMLARCSPKSRRRFRPCVKRFRHEVRPISSGSAFARHFMGLLTRLYNNVPFPFSHKSRQGLWGVALILSAPSLMKGIFPSVPNHLVATGVYGNYSLKRAIVAMVGLGANQPEGAVYPMLVRDADGEI